MQKSRRNKISKSLRKVPRLVKTDLQNPFLVRFDQGGQFKERKAASRYHSRRRRLLGGNDWPVEREFDGEGNSAILRGNFRHRVDRRSGEEVRTPLRSMHYPRWGYVTITEVHSTRPLGSGVTYTTPTINSPRPLKRSGGEERGQGTRGVRGRR